MGQKRPIETDLSAAEAEAFYAIAADENIPPEELLSDMIKEGLEQARIKRQRAKVLPLKKSGDQSK